MVEHDDSFDFTIRRSSRSLSSGYRLFRKKSRSIKQPDIVFPPDASMNDMLAILINKLLAESSRDEEETIVFQTYCFKEIFHLFQEIHANHEDIECEPELMANGQFVSLLLDFFDVDKHVQDRNTLKVQFHALEILCLLQSRNRGYSDLIAAENGISILIRFLRSHRSHSAYALSVHVQDGIVVVLQTLCSLNPRHRIEMVQTGALSYIYALCIDLRIHYDSHQHGVAAMGGKAKSPRKSLAEWLDLNEKALIRSVAAFFQSLCRIHEHNEDGRFMECLSIQLKITKMLICCSDGALQKFGALAFASLCNAAYFSFDALSDGEVQLFDPWFDSVRRKWTRWSRRCCCLCIYAKRRITTLLADDGLKAEWVENSDFIRTRSATLKTVLNHCIDHQNAAMRSSTALALLQNKNAVLRLMACTKLRERVQETKAVDLIGDEVICCLLEVALVDESDEVIAESVLILTELVDIGLAAVVFVEKEGLKHVLDAIKRADGQELEVLLDLLNLLLTALSLDAIKVELVDAMTNQGGFQVIMNLEHGQKNLEIAECCDKIMNLNPN